MKTFSITSDEPATGSSATPGAPTPEPPKGPEIPGSISMEDAIKGAEHTKINTIIGGTGFSGSSTSSVPGGSTVSIGNMVDPKLAVNMLDAVLPSLLVLLLHRLNVKIRKSELQLTEKEKEVIAPILNQCLQTLSINFDNPWMALCATLLTMYGSKCGEKIGIAVMERNVKKAEQQTAASQTNTVVVDHPSKPIIDPEWKPSEELIKRGMKEKKYSRRKSIDILKNMYKNGKIDAYGNAIKEAA